MISGWCRRHERFPGGADFRFVLFRFDPRWGFRAAFQKLTEIFPDYFCVRAREQGLWMPFTDVSTVQGWEDFGFRYHEGNNNVAWDDAHGILSFRYTEPMTWWMRAARTRPGRWPRPSGCAMKWPQRQGSGTADGAVSRVAGMWDETGAAVPAFPQRAVVQRRGLESRSQSRPPLLAAPRARPRADRPLQRGDGPLERRDQAATLRPQRQGQLDGEYLDRSRDTSRRSSISAANISLHERAAHVREPTPSNRRSTKGWRCSSSPSGSATTSTVWAN